MERIVERGRLYDFYGELLTPHQREVYEAEVYEDLSLTEIAETCGTSKQAVHDLLKRTTKSLEDYEAKLHMIRRYDEIRTALQELRNFAACTQENDAETLLALADRMEEALR
ncbi:MAG: DNA-binding protein [Butyrivibrio sp.]|nr:DNA-binding protein [Butyrivibrio sp.]